MASEEREIRRRRIRDHAYRAGNIADNVVQGLESVQYSRYHKQATDPS